VDVDALPPESLTSADVRGGCPFGDILDRGRCRGARYDPGMSTDDNMHIHSSPRRLRPVLLGLSRDVVRTIERLCIVCLLLVPTAPASADPNEVQLDRTAPVPDLRAVISEHAMFDPFEINFPSDSESIVVRSSGAQLSRSDWIVTSISYIDKAVAHMARLKSLSDAELEAEWNESDSVPPSGELWRQYEREADLVEIARRGGAQWGARVENKMNALAAWAKVHSRTAARELDEALTLARIRKQTEPVVVEVSALASSVFPDLPTAQVAIKNGSKATFEMVRGGDYRSGRESRFHIDVRDCKQRIVSDVEWPSNEDGGLSASEPLRPGEAITASLPLARYSRWLPPGDYSVQISYSNSGSIAATAEPIGRIVLVSQSIPLWVLPRVIESTASEQREITQVLAKLPGKGPVQLLTSRYGVWAEEFVPVGSPVGRLCSTGWSAVPSLVQFAAFHREQRQTISWVLAILYNVTGWLDPSAVVGDYQRHSPTQSVSGGGQTVSSRSVSSEINAGGQDALIDAWLKMVRGIELRVASN
jgi:hypothetical protein